MNHIRNAFIWIIGVRFKENTESHDIEIHLPRWIIKFWPDFPEILAQEIERQK